MPRHPDRQLERLAQPAAARMLAASRTAVLAAGSVEQHGGHLPLGTDAFAAQSIAERVAFRLDTVVAPLGPVGVAPYHLPWPGSLSLSPATLTAVLVDVCGALSRAGVSRAVLAGGDRRPPGAGADRNGEPGVAAGSAPVPPGTAAGDAVSAAITGAQR